jgi:3-dehydroquinate dehydratase-2
VPKTVHLLNGPNLNLLGLREPDVYGSMSLGDLEAMCRSAAGRHGFALEFRQTNREGQMIDWIQEARQSAGVVINPAGFTCNSIAVRDALLICECPVIEVHISNIHRRENEPWRADSVISAAATGVITGLGVHGYIAALDYFGLTLPEPGSDPRPRAAGSPSG